MPRPRSLTPGDIATAALQVIDRDGLAALSMRTVATELGAGTMSLYRYVKDREALEQLVVDQVLASVDTELIPRAPWNQQITQLAECMRVAVGAHPSIVPLLTLHRHASHGVKRCAEAFLMILTEGGFADEQRVIALRTLVSYLSGLFQAQHVGPLDGAGTQAMAELSGNQYPLLSATARVAQRLGPDREFRGGIAIVLQGLECMRRKNHSEES
ncbi:TetR/AcrR family transcriptional regulator [Paraburkholderia sp. BCC1885]|uniref:TetR/AcrR family transcriptional regulator n=1 Tax=Paraburkholderia sp. BCC1885 TaxID=2562669 RepID=UPI00118465B3|nr:TetR/AcrR family transcriptional regulator [Paraburkholderia sp. BCC1885]